MSDDIPEILPYLNLFVRLLQTLEQSDYEALLSGSGQGRLLAAILERPGTGAVLLQKRFGLARSTVSQAVRRLERTGYIERVRDHADPRRTCLLPTRQARALAPLFAVHTRAREALLLEHLGPADAEKLGALLFEGCIAVGGELRNRGVR